MIITFYSYKGGVGRSMAVANVASWLADQGLRVIVVDWDLEAPGIETYFVADAKRLSEMRQSRGLMDLLVGYRDLQPGLEQSSASDVVKTEISGVTGQAAISEALSERAAALRDVLPTVGPSLQPLRGTARASRRRLDAGIWILSAGARDGAQFGDYAQNVHSFDWAKFYAERDGAAFFHWLREELEGYSDITLIDSRTGVTEMSGACTRGLADLVVSMCAANLSNLEGVLRMTRWFLEREVMELRGRPLSAMIVPARIDGRVETKELQRFRTRFIDGVETLRDVDPDVAPEQWWELQIGYVGLYSFQERIVTGQQGESEYLQQDYDRLAQHLTLRFLAHSRDARRELAQRPIGATLRTLLTETGIAPSMQAEAAIAMLDATDQQRALKLLTRFAKLARAEEGGGATAIQVQESKFDKAARSLIDRLVSSGLLLASESPEGQTFQLSQPGLVSEWARLATSIDADRSFLEWRQRMTDSLLDWSQHRSDAYLLGGRALEEASEWTRTRSTDLVQEELDFISRSEQVTPWERIRRDAVVSPKNIVIVAAGRLDGHQSSTNVGRLFSAIDLTDRAQVAHRDVSPPTGFQPIARIASLFGWGVKRRVLDQYRFLCTHYEPGDRLLVFGAGRGAFRVRVLIDLIADQGLVTGVRGPELARLTRWAYREYRRRFYSVPAVFGILRAIRNVLLRSFEFGKERYDSSNHQSPRVHFLGLWDTLPGYGLPAQELTIAWDKWIWPLASCASQVPHLVEKVCHAVALDEERQALDPLLLDELHERVAQHVDEERITQVWFAGAHEDVAGGSNDEALSSGSLKWIAQAEKRGLRLLPHVREEWAGRSSPHGHASRSRAGLDAYYRYRPRSVRELADNRFAQVQIPRPKIHESVFQRIMAGTADYAPVAVPEHYAVVTGDGKLLDGDANPYEHPTQSQSRAVQQEYVWDDIWVRHICHSLIVGMLAAIFIAPVFLRDTALPRSRILSGVVGMLRDWTPTALQPWSDFYVSSPFMLVIPCMIVALVFLRSRSLERSIHDRMRLIWETIRRGLAPAVPPSSPASLLFRLRTHRVGRELAQILSAHLLPFVLGLSMVATLVLVAVGTANRAAFAVVEAIGGGCGNYAAPMTTPQAPAWMFTLRASDMCNFAGVRLEGGRSYRIEIHLQPDQPWQEGSRPVNTVRGFSTVDLPASLPLLPFRRVLTEQWFVPIARVGETLGESFAIRESSVIISPNRAGPLVLFVNDALGVAPLWGYFYSNNRGEAVVKVTDLGGTPP